MYANPKHVPSVNVESAVSGIQSNITCSFAVGITEILFSHAQLKVSEEEMSKQSIQQLLDFVLSTNDSIRTTCVKRIAALLTVR